MGNLIKAASNLRWIRADKSILQADITLMTGTKMQIGVCENYDTRIGVELWERANAGDFGKIAAYEEPKPEELPVLKWQLETVLLKQDIDPEQLLGPRDKALWRSAQMLFFTNEPLPALRKAAKLTEAKFKTLWSKAREID